MNPGSPAWEAGVLVQARRPPPPAENHTLELGIIRLNRLENQLLNRP